MKLGLVLFVACALTACAADSTGEDEQNSSNTNPGCSNDSTEPCYCIDDSGCPQGQYCQIADSPLPPFNGICRPRCNANDPNCNPNPPGCNAGDPNCDNTPGCNAGDPNC